MYQRILVPIDGSATSGRGLDEAIKLARLTGAELRLVHVVDELLFATGFETYAAYANDVVPFMRQAGEKILQDGKGRVENAGLKVDTVLFEGVATRLAEVVLDQVGVWSADLVVIGSHGRRGIGRALMGSDAEQVVRTAPVPVLVVRAPESAGGASTTTPASATADSAKTHVAT